MYHKQQLKNKTIGKMSYPADIDSTESGLSRRHDDIDVKEAALVLLTLTPKAEVSTMSDVVEEASEEGNRADYQSVQSTTSRDITSTKDSSKLPLIPIAESYDSYEMEEMVHFVPISDKSTLPSRKHKKSKLLLRRKMEIDPSFYRPIDHSMMNMNDHNTILPKVVTIPHGYNSAEMSPIRYQQPRDLLFDTTSSYQHRDYSLNPPSSLISCASSVDNYSVASHSEYTRSGIETTDTEMDRTFDTTATTPGESRRYYTGSISLAMSDDEESLSPLHCFMRKYCVEAFTATKDDVSNPRYGRSHGRNIEVNQVGIQCIHCRHVPYTSRQERAVCFPSSLKNIYHSIETWQRRHSLVCQYIPTWTKRCMLDLMNKSRAGAGGRRHYWEESALKLGMVDTESGIRFVSPLGETVPSSSLSSPNLRPYQTHHHQRRNSETSFASSTKSEFIPPRRLLVSHADEHLVTEYLFNLLQQMQVCYFSEQDRTGGRSKVKDCPLGYPGFECKHCSGRAGFGRYFPVSIQSLTSANSDRNIFNHIVKCRKCPQQIKDQLDYQMKQDCNSKNRRGSRKLFFRRVWERMHGTSSTATASVPNYLEEYRNSKNRSIDVSPTNF